jgi:Erv1 / Alr family
MGLPSQWGPSFWTFFHLVSLNYPNNPTDKDIEMAKLLVKSIYYILPCSLCKQHYYSNIQRNPLRSGDLTSKDDFIEWFIDLHNVVNKMLNKKHISDEEGIKKVKSLNINYKSLFSKVLNFIQVSNLDRKSKKYLMDFIKCGLYFGQINTFIEIQFTGTTSYRQLISKLTS